MTTMSFTVVLMPGIWPVRTVYAHFATEGPEALGFPHQCIQGTPGPDRPIGQCIQSKDGDDTIYCNDNIHCHMFGDSHNDRIFGWNGNDYLHGDDMAHFPELAGNDIIIAGDGDDELHGDAGSDTLSGGTGRDLFNCGTGTDTVTDYNSQEGDYFYDRSACETITPATTGLIEFPPPRPPGTTTNPQGTVIPPSCPPGFVFDASLGCVVWWRSGTTTSGTP